MIEQWKTVDVAPSYEVSGLGRIRRDGIDFTPTVGSHGYMTVNLSGAGKHRNALLHRLICKAFHGPSDKRTVNHIDGDKLNNRASNLEWATYSENQKHAISMGLAVPPSIKRGEANKRAILTQEAVLEIRSTTGWGTGRKLAAKFGVLPSTISMVRKSRTWQHIE